MKVSSRFHAAFLSGLHSFVLFSLRGDVVPCELSSLSQVCRESGLKMQSRIRFSIILVSLMLFAGASPAGDLGGPRPQNHMQAIDSAEIPNMHPDHDAPG